jgi:hypothetical protein
MMARNNVIKAPPSAQVFKIGRIPPNTPRRGLAYGTEYAQPLATEIVVCQEQSLELVKTVISAAVNITTLS